MNSPPLSDRFYGRSSGVSDLIAMLVSMLVRRASETGANPATPKSVGMGDEATNNCTNNRVGLQRSVVRRPETQTRDKSLISQELSGRSGMPSDDPGKRTGWGGRIVTPII
jgi:hypothetical protein